jgi:large subunit ribosomal protein L30e
MIDVNKHLRIAVKSGTVGFGVKDALETAKSGKGKLIMVTSNCPEHYKDEIISNAKLTGVPVHNYAGTSVDLGVACERPFAVSALSIKKEGNSEILKLAETQNVSA